MEHQTIDIGIKEDKLILNLNSKETITRDDFRKICSFIKNKAQYQKFKKFEIDFGNASFKLSGLTEKLIEKSYLFKNKEMQVVLTLGKHNLSNRDVCLEYLQKHRVAKYRINYY